ncbi:g1507 [Coccomyxa elongata]
MKFSHSLRFNANTEWNDYYINYDRLKKLIYKKEVEETKGLSLNIPEIQTRTSLDLGRIPEEAGPELDRSISLALEEDGDNIKAAFDSELSRITDFHRKKKEELLALVDKEEEKIRGAAQPDAEQAGSEASSPLLHASREAEIKYWEHDDIKTRITREQLRDEIQELYVQIQGLMDFVEVNRTGFRKALKKHDKVLGALGHPKMTPMYMPTVEAAFPEKNRLRVQEAQKLLVDLYAVVCCRGNLMLAQIELKAQLRSQLKLERTTVWKDMVEKERKRQSATVDDDSTEKAKPWYKSRAFLIALSLVVFAVLLSVPIFEEREKHNCLALLGFAAVLWCTEALPLYVTSMLVPLLAVVLRVMVDDSADPPVRKSASDAADAIFKAMFSNTIMLLLGGFAIASAFTKHSIARRFAVWALSRISTRPQVVLLASMFLATITSMFITNVAAPVLCFSVLDPILRTLPSGHSFGKALVLGIALASNLGGMTSPISSPQNIFAIQEMGRDAEPPSWLAWFAVALPVACLGNLACWGCLLLAYRPGRTLKEVRRMPTSSDPITWKQMYVVAISVATIGLWCANTALSKYTGQMGIVAIVPMVAFFGFGLLSKDDFNNQLWNVVMLAMGGSALGEAVKSSGLLESIAHSIENVVAGMGLWAVFSIFCALVLVATTFISHTVGAMVILPIVSAVGSQMVEPHPRLLVMGAALMCSGAMGLAVSGFPNMTAIAKEDPTGNPWLSNADFFKVGVPCSLATYGLIVSVGYGIMRFMLGW